MEIASHNRFGGLHFLKNLHNAPQPFPTGGSFWKPLYCCLQVILQVITDVIYRCTRRDRIYLFSSCWMWDPSIRSLLLCIMSIHYASLYLNLKRGPSLEWISLPLPRVKGVSLPGNRVCLEMNMLSKKSHLHSSKWFWRQSSPMVICWFSVPRA